MRFRTLAFVTGLAALAGCSDKFTEPDPKPAAVRIVNSTWQVAASGDLTTAEPRELDVLIDSAADRGVVSVPPNSVTGIEGAPASLTLGEGIHSWTPRFSAPATPQTSLYSNTADPRGELLPRMYFTPNTSYTLVVAGVAPAVGRPDPGAFFVSDFQNRVPLVDDLDPPPVVNGQRLARFRLVNAAPFAAGGSTGATIGLQLTEGSTFPTLAQINTLFSITSAAYRQQSATYVNVTPGDYVVNVTTGGAGARRILQQQAVTFAPGQVRTVLVQNTAYAAVPSPANHKLTVLLDAEYD